MKHEPTLIQFSDMKADERAKSKENTVSVNMGGKTLLLYAQALLSVPEPELGQGRTELR